MAKKRPRKSPQKKAKKPAKKAQKKRAAKPQKQAPEPRIITGKPALAQHYEVTKETVSTWEKKGLPFEVDGRCHVFDLDKTDPWVSAFRKDLEKEDDPATLAKMRRNEALAKQDELKASRMEREEEEAQGNILRRDEYQLAFKEIISLARDRLISQIPREMCRLFPKKYHKSVQQKATNAVRKILDEMARLAERGPTD